MYRAHTTALCEAHNCVGVFAVLNKCACVSINVATIVFGHIHQLLLRVPKQTQHADADGSTMSSSTLDRC